MKYFAFSRKTKNTKHKTRGSRFTLNRSRCLRLPITIIVVETFDDFHFKPLTAAEQAAITALLYPAPEMPCYKLTKQTASCTILARGHHCVSPDPQHKCSRTGSIRNYSLRVAASSLRPGNVRSFYDTYCTNYNSQTRL